MWLTLVVALIVFFIVVGFCAWVVRPVYRIDRNNIIRLLNDVFEARACEQDWLVFTAIPIRYDPYLDDVRQRCLAVEETHLLGDASRFLFDTEGLLALQEILAELESKTPSSL